MGQQVKCFIGAHVFEIKDELPVINEENVKVGINYVSRCKHCGKIKSTFVATNDKWLDFYYQQTPAK